LLDQIRIKERAGDQFNQLPAQFFVCLGERAQNSTTNEVQLLSILILGNVLK
jgi:hypothetical protein